MSLKRTLASVLATAALISIGNMAGAQGGAAGKDAAHLTRAELLAKVDKTTDGLAIFSLPTGAHATALEVHRDKSGEVEVHKSKDDIFVAHAGAATVLIGDQADGGRETTPGEWRGGVIKAPKSFALAPGDVVWIPAGKAHQVVLAPGGSFNYLAIKFDPPQPPK